MNRFVRQKLKETVCVCVHPKTAIGSDIDDVFPVTELCIGFVFSKVSGIRDPLLENQIRVSDWKGIPVKQCLNKVFV